MTAEEAMDRAQLIVTSCCRCQNPGVPLDEAIAAALIRAQLTALRSPSTRQILIVECEAALAKLEARDA